MQQTASEHVVTESVRPSALQTVDLHAGLASGGKTSRGDAPKDEVPKSEATKYEVPIRQADAAAPRLAPAQPLEFFERRPKTRDKVSANKLEKRLLRETGRAIADYQMIEDGDRVMVCLSGGKDSYGMLDLLIKLRERAPIQFDIIAVNLDQKQPGFPEEVLPNYLRSISVPFRIEEQDTYSVVKRLIPEGKTTCSLCSRLRRGALYRVASEIGATKIALGHHRDDILGTFFLNLFFAARLKAMPPKLVSDNGQHTVIRPLAYVQESDLEAYAEIRRFPIIPCNLCGSQENLKRKEISAMLRQWERQSPQRVWNTFKALANVVPSHLMDTSLFDFKGLKPDGRAFEDGDTAFDEPELPATPTTLTSFADED